MCSAIWLVSFPDRSRIWVRAYHFLWMSSINTVTHLQKWMRVSLSYPIVFFQKMSTARSTCTCLKHPWVISSPLLCTNVPLSRHIYMKPGDHYYTWHTVDFLCNDFNCILGGACARDLKGRETFNSIHYCKAYYTRTSLLINSCMAAQLNP